jgi:hypothetical protein
MQPKNRAKTGQTAPLAATSPEAALLQSIQSSSTGLTLADLLVQHPALARRTAQRWLSQWVAAGQITTQGEARARRYLASAVNTPATSAVTSNSFPANIPLSADSQDIVAYVTQTPQARTPVGYQRDFLDAYQPNVSNYLSAPLRRQLHNMGKTSRMGEPAGTYSRAILNRLMIDLSWASSQAKGIRQGRSG